MNDLGPDYAALDDDTFVARYRAHCHCGAVHFAYILEKAEAPREMRRAFRAQRTGKSRLTPGSLDPASILSARNRNGSLQRLNGR